jgi:hypothetical protein
MMMGKRIGLMVSGGRVMRDNSCELGTSRLSRPAAIEDFNIVAATYSLFNTLLLSHQ